MCGAVCACGRQRKKKARRRSDLLDLQTSKVLDALEGEEEGGRKKVREERWYVGRSGVEGRGGGTSKEAVKADRV